MVIELQDNTVYIDGFDKKHKIMGRTLDLARRLLV
jgi:hypothetical protein